MNGPEHYREAERLLAELPTAHKRGQELGASGETLAAAIENLTAQAQVHATLAHAAAVIDTGTGDVLEPKWYEVIQ